jgi:hypothetical protein
MRKAEAPPMTGGQAKYILEKLIDEGKVTAADVRRHFASMWEEMNFLEKRISELRGAAAAAARHPVHEAKVAIKRIRTRARKVVTAERAASQKVQGQYLGYLRQFPKKSRKPFQEMARADGREAAIDAMRKKLGK